jgi:hypothetical protein
LGLRILGLRILGLRILGLRILGLRIFRAPNQPGAAGRCRLSPVRPGFLQTGS